MNARSSSSHQCAAALRHTRLGERLHELRCLLTAWAIDRAQVGDRLEGIAVHIGARVGALAEPNEILVSGTVKDLVVGSAL